MDVFPKKIEVFVKKRVILIPNPIRILQVQEHEQLVMKLNQSEHLLTLSQIESQTLAQSLEEKGSILENLKVEFESKAQELLDIQMEKMKIEEESTALNERFLDLRAVFLFETILNNVFVDFRHTNNCW